MAGRPVVSLGIRAACRDASNVGQTADFNLSWEAECIIYAGLEREILNAVRAITARK